MALQFSWKLSATAENYNLRFNDFMRFFFINFILYVWPIKSFANMIKNSKACIPVA